MAKAFRALVGRSHTDLKPVGPRQTPCCRLVGRIVPLGELGPEAA
jgi:hypothetical protein